MQQATDLIGGLAGERKRWTEDSAKFDATKTALVGDVAVGAISASRRVEAPSLPQYDSCPSHNEVGGLFFDFEPLRTAVEGPRTPCYVPAVQVVGQVDGDERARRRRVDAHVVRRVVLRGNRDDGVDATSRTLTPHEELGPRVALDVVTIKIAPPQLDVQPVFGRRRAIIRILRIM